jgi:hypothetical protein
MTTGVMIRIASALMCLACMCKALLVADYTALLCFAGGFVLMLFRLMIDAGALS